MLALGYLLGDQATSFLGTKGIILGGKLTLQMLFWLLRLD